MKRALVSACLLLTLLTLSAACHRGEGDASPGSPVAALFPEIEPIRSGYLRVSDLHEIYWEVCGNPEGVPVFVLHGGPGGRAGPEMRQYFDPQRFFIILHDQRGGGRSRPVAEWRENTTQHLVEDVNRLREHLGITGKAILWGGSWGSTLALAYAETYPERVSGLVLRGVFLGTQGEIDHFYHGGTGLLFPENYERLRELVPDPESLDYPRQLFEMTQSDDPATRKRAIDGWAYYEIRMVSVGMSDEQCQEIVDQYDLTSFSVLENHYMSHRCFLEENQLLRDASKIAHLPTFIVNGRFDVICPPRNAWELSKRIENVKLEFPPGAGHTAREEANTRALVRGTEWVADQVAAAVREP
ncbi:MAG: prolyl aminopeptidase [bacterium]|nr:prolyl aminopeptidase [bacterium]